MSKRNNQTLIFDADRDMITLGSVDNAGNKSRFRHYPFILGMDFSVGIGDR